MLKESFVWNSPCCWVDDDDNLGQALLQSSDFHPEGFEGLSFGFVRCVGFFQFFSMFNAPLLSVCSLSGEISIGEGIVLEAQSVPFSYEAFAMMSLLRHVRIEIVVPEVDEEVIDPAGHVGHLARFMPQG